ncbi:seminase [Drosophila kikkawai]|uniref:Seminase n=1 Tax=Drosophila kikkawai TaxID=30033 RepID=A0A6P4J8C8_DROKI|nr:seminase [Drosophila kikkawai]
MGLLSLCIFQAILFAALGDKVGTHFHRYMLSDYKPQHNPKTQRDYHRHNPRNTIQEADGSHNLQRTQLKKGRSQGIEDSKANEPLVLLTKSRKTVMLHLLIVRIYQDNNYICTGTQISELLVVTAVPCFDSSSSELVDVKTFDGEVIPGRRMNKNETIAQSEDSQLAFVLLNKRPLSSVLRNDSVQLCNSRLQDNSKVVMPIWIRARNTIQSTNTRTVLFQACQKLMKDHQETLSPDSMICVKNNKFTSTCQRSIGNPIIYNKMICGVNLFGHNCPTVQGIILYSTIYDLNEIEMNGNKMIRKLDIEESVL